MIQFLIAVGILIVTVLVVAIIQLVKYVYHKFFCTNCFGCKHWKLYDVASLGDGCDFICKKNGMKTPHMISINNREWWVKKCKDFEIDD